MHLLAFGLVTFHCLKNRREATSAVLWIFMAWSLPLMGPLLFLAFGINHVPRKAWHKRRSDTHLLTQRRAREDAAMPLAYWQSVHDAVATEPPTPFARDLNHAMNGFLREYPLLGGNHITPLVTGDEAYPRMLKAIRQARHHIHCQAYIIGPGATGREFLDALCERAEAGVTVRFLYDRVGSGAAWLTGMLRRYRRRSPALKIEGWTQASLWKRRFQINLRNHRKVLIVDGEQAFTGGVNFHRANTTHNNKQPIRDYHFALRGPIVQELQYMFLCDWYFMTDENPEDLLRKEHFPHLPAEGDALIRAIPSGPSSDSEVMTDTVFAMLTAARKDILAVTPYFVPTQSVLTALRAAALRGVKIRLVVPEKNNHFYAGMASRALYDDLLRAGMRIFERPPPFIHAKALIVDDKVALVGSGNLDVRSLRLNYESNLAVYSEPFINHLKRIVLEDISHSHEIHLTAWRARPGRQQLLENFCNLFTPVL